MIMLYGLEKQGGASRHRHGVRENRKKSEERRKQEEKEDQKWCRVSTRRGISFGYNKVEIGWLFSPNLPVRAQI